MAHCEDTKGPWSIEKEVPNHGSTGKRSHDALSSTSKEPNALSPPPAFLEPAKITKDDTFVNGGPVMPQRPKVPRGLSLQLPRYDISSSSTANLTTSLMRRTPLSPKLDSSTSFCSAASVLPRRSRGMDFSRACTNLHHSTLAEQSSPDSSPVIGGRAMNIPRKGTSGPDSPMFANSLWSTMAGSERTTISSSVGSVNMMDSGSDNSSSDEDMLRGGEDEDTIHMTPQPHRTGFGSFGMGNAPSPSIESVNPFSPAAANLMSFHRRIRNGRTTRKSSSSASRQSSLHSPGPASPPLLKSIETGSSGSYFTRDLDKKEVESRRESLSLGTNDLNISDGAESEEPEAMRSVSNDVLGLPISLSSKFDERRSVIRRAVTRRSNMLPKPKNFARIRAALQEEVSPVDTESRREAEVIRQVRENDDGQESSTVPSQPGTAASSPSLAAATAGPTDNLDDLTEMMGGETSTERRASSSFTTQALKNSGGPEFWNSFDDRMRTPPPLIFPRGSSSTMSEDMNVDTPASSAVHGSAQYWPSTRNSSPSRSSTPQPIPTANEVTRKTLGKRRRDDDLDPNMFKRRAVSPGLSLQNSPILPPSPAQREGGWWQIKANREGSIHNSVDRASSGSSANGSGPLGKRVGMQGMNDTNDGLMNMSIE